LGKHVAQGEEMINEIEQQQQQELQRIRELADSVACPQCMLAAILKRLAPSYLYRDPSDRQTAKELLTPDLKDKAMLLHKVVGASGLHEILKQRVCGAVEFYLRRIGVDAEEMQVFKSGCQFDPVTYGLFAGLELDGE
jgi:hypothetical protein